MNSSGVIPMTPPMEPVEEGSSSSDSSSSTKSTSLSSGNIIANRYNNENNAIAAIQWDVIQGRLEEFAAAFLGMSVFDVADAWTVAPSSSNEHNPIRLKCLFTVAATNTNPKINLLRGASMNVLIDNNDGAVGKTNSSGCSVWSSIKVSCVGFN